MSKELLAADAKAVQSKHHFPSEHYGRGVCGAHGMMNENPSGVNCERCKKTARFNAALNIATRYAGRKAK